MTTAWSSCEDQAGPVWPCSLSGRSWQEARAQKGNPHARQLEVVQTRGW